MDNSTKGKTAGGRIVSQLSSSEHARRGLCKGSTALWRGVASTAILAATAWALTPGMAAAQTCAPPGNVSTACSGGECAVISVGSPGSAAGSTVQIPISFTQGKPPSQMKEPDGGYDQVSAIAFTLGISGDGSAPLTFNCTPPPNSDLVAGAITVGDAIANDFTVVVENAQCNSSRNRCLCPDTNAGQTRDNFVNLVVYGPKTLPAPSATPPIIPILPQSGVLLTLNMQVAQNAPSSIPLHIYSALDTNPGTPHFGANLSIGDQGACDVTANSQNRSNVAFTPGAVAVSTSAVGTTPTAPPTTPGTSVCVGDCNHDRKVTVSELIIGVNIVLGTNPTSSCTAFEDSSGMVGIAQLIKGVNNLLNECPAS